MLPWKQTSVLSERMRLVERYALGEESLAELSRQLGISRKTAYKTIRRHDIYGELGLLDLSRGLIIVPMLLHLSLPNES